MGGGRERGGIWELSAQFLCKLKVVLKKLLILRNLKINSTFTQPFHLANSYSFFRVSV